MTAGTSPPIVAKILPLVEVGLGRLELKENFTICPCFNFEE